ncbi:unnamed protein product [Paramecium sonneborni]|uniref:Steroid 5-alpha reductase C-terminal domain-containing protein n=1 Tax=Paramecium sonneborni TaxID=65129 RepID=A0A8S1QBB0_9CILI|nr:unnamed protein product [Paramecium sonneborni]
MQELIEIGLKKVLPGILLNQIAFYSLYKILKNNECIVDVAYTVSHFVAGSIYAYHFGLSSFENKFKLGLLALWTARLAGFLFYYRILRGFRDPRYEVIFVNYKKETFKRDVVVFGQYIFQGFIVLVTSSSLYFLFKNSLNPYQLAILGTSIFWIYLEGLSDHQLQSFKDQKNKAPDSICQDGLWKKSRHPNLFFDLMTWTTIAISSIKSKNDALALISPLVLYYVMARLTVPITEKLMKKKRGDKFTEYCSKTNKFLPI